MGKRFLFVLALELCNPITKKQVGTGAEIHSAIASGVVTGDVVTGQLSAIFFLVSSNSSRSLFESKSSQFPFRFTILHATEHQIKKEHTFITKLLKTP